MKPTFTSDLPRERLKQLGPRALSLKELLAILFRSGTSQQSVWEQVELLLERFPTQEKLASASLAELTQVPGIGFAKACQLLAALELGRRLLFPQSRTKTTIRSSRDVAQVCTPLFCQAEKEMFVTLGLNAKHQVEHLWITAIGSLLSCPVHPREVFRPLIRDGLSACIVAHNHPSTGDPEPSPEDIKITRRLREVGELVGIPLLDHLIFGSTSYVSLRDRGHWTEGKPTARR